MYLLSVTVCCDISARVARPTDLYATCYIGLLFDLRVSTYLISLLHCPLCERVCKKSVYMVYIQTILTCPILGTPLSA
jgi:hypothetical protein